MNTGHIKAALYFVVGVAGVFLGHYGIAGASAPVFLAVVLCAVIAIFGWWLARKAANTQGWVPVVSIITLTAAAVTVAFAFGGSLQFTLFVLFDVAFVVALVVLGWWIKRSDTRALNFRRVIASEYKMSYNPAAGGTDGTN